MLTATTELSRRLSRSSAAVRNHRKVTVTDPIIAAIQDAVRQLPSGGSRRHAVIHKPDNWATSFFYTVREARAKGASRDQVMAIGYAVCHGLEAMLAIEDGLVPQHLIDLVQRETQTEAEQNLATNEALHQLTLGTAARLRDWSLRQAQASKDLARGCTRWIRETLQGRQIGAR
jgi:hypothetical protein